MAADFNAGVLTDKGKALLAKWHEGSCVPELTRAAAGAGTYTSGEDLNGRTALKDERMSIGFSHIETQNETTVALRFTLTNEDLTEGFTITEIGVFATDPDEGEILYSIATTADESTADYMPAYNGEYPTTIIFNYQIEVANAASVTIVAGSTGMYALAADLEAAEVKIENLETATADLEDQIEDAVKELEEDIVVKVDEAKEAADKAQETADQAVADASTAQSAAESAQSTADQAVSDASAAQSSADAAQKSADEAQETADQAVKDAATAQSTADQAVSDAAIAQSTADQAEKDAQAAQSTADQAVTNAATAQSTAEKAQTTADSATTAAATAQTTADQAQASADQAVAGLTDGSVTKVGTATVGSGTNPIYLDSGTPKASTATIGSDYSPVFLENGEFEKAIFTFYDEEKLKAENWYSNSRIDGYNYAYDIYVDNLTEDSDYVIAFFEGAGNSNYPLTYGISNFIELHSGYFIIFAKEMPASSIYLYYFVIRCSMNYATDLKGSFLLGGETRLIEQAQSTADTAKSGLTDGSVTKVGTSTVGGAAKPIYLDGGTPTACSLYPTLAFTLSPESWSPDVSGDYNYSHILLIDGVTVTADTIALAFLNTSCASVAGDAGMCSVVESSSGRLTFRAVDIPTADITGSVVLLNT